jgi:nucleoside-diphosphate-sugar epimerase
MAESLLITGSGGFIGKRLVNNISNVDGFNFTLVSRGKALIDGLEKPFSEIGPYTEWTDVLRGRSVVIHLAGIAHISNNELRQSSSHFRSVNVLGTLNLAQQAAKMKVSRFVFISSVSVNGVTSNRAFVEGDEPFPTCFASQCKFEVEKGLWAIQKKTGMEVVIIRPPLVYGPNAPGNFGFLLSVLEKGFPLPFGAIYNKRTIVGIDNLCDLIMTCVVHPAAANQIFFAGDGQDLSTTELLNFIARATGKSSRLIPIPSRLLMLAASLIGKKNIAQRLLGSLQVDISKAQNLLGWVPPISLEEGLLRCFIKD